MKKAKIFTLNDVENLLKGCCFLASGGGGSFKSGENLIKLLKAEQKKSGINIPVITLENITSYKENKGPYGIVLAYMGAPEKLNNINLTAVSSAFEKMNNYCLEKNKCSIEYLVPGELGALSTTLIFNMASKYNLQVIDADGAGRAVPELPMLTFAAELEMDKKSEIPSAVIASEVDLNEKESTIVQLNVSSPSDVESTVRPFISAGVAGFDQSAGVALWLMNYDEMGKALKIRDTITNATKLGESILKNKGSKLTDRIVETLRNQGSDGKLLFSGEITKVIVKTVGGFDINHIYLNAKNETNEYIIYAVNENLIAWDVSENKPLCTAPHSICFITDDGKPFSCADIEEMKLVKTIAKVTSDTEITKLVKNYTHIKLSDFDETVKRIMCSPSKAKTATIEGNSHQEIPKTVHVIAVKSHSALEDTPSIKESFLAVLKKVGYPGKLYNWDKDVLEKTNEVEKETPEMILSD